MLIPRIPFPQIIIQNQIKVETFNGINYVLYFISILFGNCSKSIDLIFFNLTIVKHKNEYYFNFSYNFVNEGFYVLIISHFFSILFFVYHLGKPTNLPFLRYKIVNTIVYI